MPGGSPQFRTTRWSAVLAAAERTTPAARTALSDLCEQYWYPLYAFARRRGLEAADAEDAVQAFFAVLLERPKLAHADPERGRFRSFLVASFQNFLHNERAKRTAQKRGSGKVTSLVDPEGRYRREPSHDETPERLCQRAWTLTLLRTVLGEVRRQYEERGDGATFDALRGHLDGQGGGPLAETARALGLTEGAARVALHRLRRRYRDALRRAVLDTVAAPGDVDDELGVLLEAVGGSNSVGYVNTDRTGNARGRSL